MLLSTLVARRWSLHHGCFCLRAADHRFFPTTRITSTVSRWALLLSSSSLPASGFLSVPSGVTAGLALHHDRPNNQALLWTGPRRDDSLSLFQRSLPRRVAGQRTLFVMQRKAEHGRTANNLMRTLPGLRQARSHVRTWGTASRSLDLEEGKGSSLICYYLFNGRQLTVRYQWFYEYQ